MADRQESAPIQLSGVSITSSSVAVGPGARAGDVTVTATGEGDTPWKAHLAEVRRLIAQLRESGELAAEDADAGLERADVLEAELGQEKPRRTLVLDTLANLARTVEGLAGVGNAVALLTAAVRAVFQG